MLVRDFFVLHQPKSTLAAPSKPPAFSYAGPIFQEGLLEEKSGEISS
jgi:hypothetical protein